MPRRNCWSEQNAAAVAAQHEESVWSLARLAEHYCRVVAVLKRCRQRGRVKVRSWQSTDSTHVLGRARVTNRMALAQETLRTAMNDFSHCCPGLAVRQQAAGLVGASR